MELVSAMPIVGVSAVVLAAALLSAYMPWSPSALIWPYEWAMVLTWAALGGLLFQRWRASHSTRFEAGKIS